MAQGNFARIEITCSTEDAENLIENHKGELGRRVFYFLEEKLHGPIEVYLTIKVNDQYSKRIWSRS